MRRMEFSVEMGWRRSRARHRGPTQQAMSQGNLLNSQAEQQGAESRQLFGMAAPAVQKMINSPGYTPQQQNAIVGQTVGAAAEPYATAADEARRTAAETGNSAGVDVSLDNMAREKSAAMDNAAQQAQLAIANDQQSQEQQGIADAGQLFGTTEGTGAKLYGSATPLFGQQTKGPFDYLLGAAGGIGSAMAGAGY